MNPTLTHAVLEDYDVTSTGFPYTDSQGLLITLYTPDQRMIENNQYPGYENISTSFIMKEIRKHVRTFQKTW